MFENNNEPQKKPVKAKKKKIMLLKLFGVLMRKVAKA